MEFKKFKYYFIMVMLLVMIVCVTAFTGYNVTNGSIDSTLPEQPGDEIEEPDIPDISDDGEEEIVLPNFKTWDKLWEYSYNILLKGYNSSFTTTVNSTSLGISATQSSVGNESLENGELFMETFTTNDSSMVGTEATYYEYERITQDYSEKRKTHNINYDEKTYTFTDEPVIKTERAGEVEPYIYALRNLELNSNNISSVSFDKLLSESYYTIKLTYKIDKLTEGYYNAFTSTGLVNSVSINSISFEIKIIKKNAKLYSIKTIEEYKSEVSFMPITADCYSTTLQIFQII